VIEPPGTFGGSIRDREPLLFHSVSALQGSIASSLRIPNAWEVVKCIHIVAFADRIRQGALTGVTFLPQAQKETASVFLALTRL